MCFPRGHLQFCTFYPADLFRAAFFKALFILIASLASQLQKQTQDPICGEADFATLLHLSFFILGSLSYRDELGSLFRLLWVLAHVLAQASAKSEFLQLLEVIENRNLEVKC